MHNFPQYLTGWARGKLTCIGDEDDMGHAQRSVIMQAVSASDGALYELAQYSNPGCAWAWETSDASGCNCWSFLSPVPNRLPRAFSTIRHQRGGNPKVQSMAPRQAADHTGKACSIMRSRMLLYLTVRDAPVVHDRSYCSVGARRSASRAVVPADADDLSPQAHVYHLAAKAA